MTTPFSSTFKNDQSEAFFNKYGYLHIESFLNKETIKTLLDLYKSLHTEVNSKQNQWNSLYHLKKGEGLEVSNFIRNLLYDQLEEIFDNLSYPVGTFMSKNPNKGSTCEVHRDFTVYDENIIQFRNIWIPLIDINKQNGALYVIPGSHHLFHSIRPMFSEWEYKHIDKHILKYKKTIYAKAGDLIVYSDKTLHGSLENLSASTRPVIHGGVIPPESSLYYYHLENGMVKKYKVDHSFYLDNMFEDLSSLGNYELIESFLFNPKKIARDDLRELKRYQERFSWSLFNK